MNFNSDSASGLPTDKELVLREFTMPADVNHNGDIFGGWVMARIDLAGAVLPRRLSRGRVATVAVNQIVFEHPLHVGDLISFYADVTRIGNTSVTVAVDVYAERLQEAECVVKVTEAVLTYVAIDEDGRPRPVLSSGLVDAAV
jgi:acyl-CoA thioesterase YciA